MMDRDVGRWAFLGAGVVTLLSGGAAFGTNGKIEANKSDWAIRCATFCDLR